MRKKLAPAPAPAPVAATPVRGLLTAATLTQPTGMNTAAPVTGPSLPAQSAAAPAFVPQDASVSGQLDKVLSADSPLLTAARTRGAQVANRRGLLNSSLGVQAGEAAAYDVALPIASQNAAQISQSNLQGGQIVSQERLSASAIASQERIAAANVASFEREKATAALAQFDNNYEEAFRTISANENIPAETRQQYLTHLGAIRDTNFNLIEQLYNIDLTWQSAVS